MIKRSLFLPALVLLPSLSMAQMPDNCEPLRAQIEANIVAKGVSGFTLTVVAAGAAMDGEVVGSCANGTRKIVYAKGASPARQAKPAHPVRPRLQSQDDDILTECRDGSVVRGNHCKN